jgi:hypothetical protein
VVYAIAALGLVGLGVAFWLSSRPAKVDPARAAAARTALEAAGCTLRLVAAPDDAADHIRSPEGSGVEWATDPPTAGPHYGEPAVYGSYREPLEQARVLHNLEHGAIALQYGDGVPAETVRRLEGFYEADPTGLLLAPYPTLGGRIALGAWIGEGGGKRGQGVLATCPVFDRRAYKAFVAAYRFHGPERVKPSALQPGSR